jgi:hypothetical protein
MVVNPHQCPIAMMGCQVVGREALGLVKAIGRLQARLRAGRRRVLVLSDFIGRPRLAPDPHFPDPADETIPAAWGAGVATEIPRSEAGPDLIEHGEEAIGRDRAR